MNFTTASRTARAMLPLAVVVALIATMAASATTAASAGDVPRSSANGCTFVTKVVHGKRKRVRVCVKPKPPVSPPLLGSVTATIALPDEAADEDDMAYGEGSLWVIDSHGLLRINPVTNAVVARIAGPDSKYGGVVVADGAVWWCSYYSGQVYRVNPATNQIVATINVPDAPEGLTTTPGAVWVASHHGPQSVSRIDTATNKVVATIPVGSQVAGDCCGPQRIAAGAGAVWVGVPRINGVARIDPVTNSEVATITAGQSCGDLAADSTSVWVTNSSCSGNGVTRIDPATNKVVATPRLQGIWTATGVTFVNGAVYVGVNDSPSHMQGLEKIDPSTNTVAGILPIPGLPSSGDAGHLTLVYAAGSLWMRAPGKVIRVQLTS